MKSERACIDIHAHLAGVGTRGSGCWISPGFRTRPTFSGLRLLMGLSRRQMGTTADQDWGAFISALVAKSEVDLAVVLGFDGVYDAYGRFDPVRSQLVVPPAWVFRVCERYANLLPAPSINPYRSDALDLLDETIDRGAVMIKWLPVVQAFDPGSRRSKAFLARMADAGIPLLIHAGTGELTFRTIDPTVGGLDRVLQALDLGVKVVCAHTAAPVHLSRRPDELPRLRFLLERYDRLWVDNSGLANPSRFLHLPRFADDPLIASRTLHGSDFPVVSSARFYWGRLGREQVETITAERNPFQKDLMLKRAVGFDDDSFTRAVSVLANLDRWKPDPPSTGT